MPVVLKVALVLFPTLASERLVTTADLQTTGSRVVDDHEDHLEHHKLRTIKEVKISTMATMDGLKIPIGKKDGMSMILQLTVENGRLTLGVHPNGVNLELVLQKLSPTGTLSTLQSRWKVNGVTQLQRGRLHLHCTM